MINATWHYQKQYTTGQDDLVFEYVPSTNSYKLVTVSSTYSYDELMVPSLWDDGVHGELPVTVIGEYVLQTKTYDYDKAEVDYGVYNKIITTIIISENITRIEDNAFIPYKDADDFMITTFVLPSSLSYIGSHAFYMDRANCASTVYYNGSMDDWMLVTGGADSMLFDIGTNTFWVANVGSSGTNGNNTTTTYDNKTYYKVRNLVIPNSVKKVPEYRFYGFNQLVSVTIPDGFEEFGTSSFAGASNVKNIYMKGSMDGWFNITFDDEASNPFYYVTSGTTAFFAKSVGSSGTTGNGSTATVNGVTYYKMLNITVPSSVTTVKSYAFINFNINSFTIHSKVTSIANNAFGSDKTRISDVYYLETEAYRYANLDTTINNETIDDESQGAIWHYTGKYVRGDYDLVFEYSSSLNGYILLYVKPSYAYSELIIPSLWSDADADSGNHGELPVFEIGGYVLSSGSSSGSVATNVKTVTIPSSVKTIGDNAFRGNTKITSYSIETTSSGSGVKTIGAYAFYGCTGLTTIDIPYTVTTLGAYAFANCSNVTTINFYKYLVSVGDYAFNNTTKVANVYFNGGINEYMNLSVCFPGCYSNVSGGAIFWVTSYDSCGATGNSTTKTYNGTKFYKITNLKISSSITTIPYAKFSKMKQLVSVEIPSSVTSIEGYAFSNLTSFTKLTIVPMTSGKLIVGSYAFNGCSNLADVYYDNSESYKNSHMTINTGNTSLTGATWHYKTVYTEGQEYLVFTYDSSTQTYTLTSVKTGYTLSTLTVPALWNDGTNGEHPVKSIGKFFLKQGTYSGTYVSCITTLIISEGITKLDGSALSNSTSITTLYIPSTITNFPRPNLANLKNTYYGGSMDDWFSIDFTEGTPHISSNKNATYWFRSAGVSGETGNRTSSTFNNQTFYKVTNVVVPSTITEIGSYTLTRMTQITQIVIPKSVTAIQNFAIYVENNCNVYYNGTPDEWCNIVKSTINNDNKLTYWFSGVGSSGTTGNGTSSTYNGTTYYKVTRFTIPSTFTKLACIFYGFKQMVSVTIPSSVTTITDSTFAYCTGLTSITIPNSVTTISNSAFAGCTGLTTITIPSSVKNMSGVAFYKSGLRTIHFEAVSDGKLVIGVNVFLDVSSITDVYYNNTLSWKTDHMAIDSSNSHLINATWHYQEEIKDYAPGQEYMTFSYDSTEQVYTLTGIATGFNLSTLEVPSQWNDGTNGEHPVTKIGAYAIKQGSSSGTVVSSITKIVIPDSIESIGYLAFANSNITFVTGTINSPTYSFQNCKNLVSAIGIKSLSSYAFAGCTSLKSVGLNFGITEISISAFSGCTSLEYIEIPDSVETIAYGAFSSTNIKHLVLSNIVTIGERAFENSALVDIILPISVRTISTNAFSGCASLKKVTIQDGPSVIDSNAFSGCTNLAEITIPASVTSIGSNAFSNCPALQTIYYEGTKVKKNAISISSGNNALSTATWYCENDIYGYQYLDIRYINGTYCLFYVSENFQNTTLYIPSQWNDGVHGLDNVTYVAANAVDGYSTGNYSNITKIVFPDTIERIDAEAFRSLNITELELGDGLIEIAQEAFRNCAQLQSLTFGSNIQYIYENAFAGCAALEYIGFRRWNGVSAGNEELYIKQGAFTECHEIKYIYFPPKNLHFDSSVFDIGSVTAQTIKVLGDAVGISQSSSEDPDGILNGALGCNVTYEYEEVGDFSSYYQPDKVPGIDAMTFLPNEDNNGYILTGIDTAGHDLSYLEWLRIPEMYEGLPVTAIGDGENPLFTEGNSFTKILTIPCTVKVINNYAFADMDALQEVSFATVSLSQDGLEVEKTDLVEIGAHAFSGCSSLKELNLLKTSIQIIDNGAFDGCSNFRRIFIPNTITTFNPGFAEVSEGYSDIELYYNGSVSDWMNVSLSDKTATTALRFWVTNISPCATAGNTNTSYVDGETYYLIRNLTIPSGERRVRGYQFSNFKMITRVNISVTTTAIGNCAFLNCDLLTDVYYSGNESQKASMTIGGSGNGTFYNATWHYNS